jgi:hypothetical protein
MMRLLDGAHISAHVALPVAEVENRVADKLAGAVIGDVAAAIGGVESDAGAAQDFVAGEHVGGWPLRPSVMTCGCSSSRSWSGMSALLALGGKLPLQLQRLAVIRAPEFPQTAFTH